MVLSNNDSTKLAAESMLDFGGSFAACIGAAYLHADTQNAAILRHAFASLFAKYGAQYSPDGAKFGAMRLVWNLSELEAEETSEDDICQAIADMDLRIMTFPTDPTQDETKAWSDTYEIEPCTS